MRKLPEGSVTFVFTDIEASTRLAEALGDAAWADLLEAHQELLRSAFAAHGGVEVATEGDAFFVAFAKPLDAVLAASDGQRAIEGHPWPDGNAIRVRIGLHTGDALVRDGDYVGHAVHAAKRVADAGHGGQIVLSATTAERLGTAVAMRDLGLHRLKDLAEPRRIFQVVVEGVQADFPPLRALGSFHHNLPTQRTPLVGREDEIQAVRALLEHHRLVTLTGIGGCGKTRLGLHVGAELVNSYADGVFFVDLAAVSDPNELTGAVGSALGLPKAVGVQATEVGQQVLDRLSRARCLLIVDNCEHVLDDSAQLIDRILDGCPNVTVLATSREAMDLDDERAVRVPSLSVPTGDGDVMGSDAAKLFVARAQAVAPDFDVTVSNADAIAEICRRLDGIPLAIELAAARASHLSPQQIAGRLGDMFRLLTGGRRRVQRQQTLQAALDWSYDLLNEREQRLLARLGVFPGTFGLAAVESVCGDGDLAATTLDLLGSLVAKSLVNVLLDGEEVRYRLLESVRLFAEEHLRASDEADQLRTRHCDVYLAWLDAFERDRLWLDPGLYERLDVEMANIRASLRWALAAGRRTTSRAQSPRSGRSGTTPESSPTSSSGHRASSTTQPTPTPLTSSTSTACVPTRRWAGQSRQRWPTPGKRSSSVPAGGRWGGSSR